MDPVTEGFAAGTIVMSLNRGAKFGHVVAQTLRDGLVWTCCSTGFEPLQIRAEPQARLCGRCAKEGPRWKKRSAGRS